MKKILLGSTVLWFILACNSTNNKSDIPDSSAQVTVHEVSAIRNEIKKEAVAIYEVPLEGDQAKLNKWHYTVKLFETADRFRYRVDMQYEEISGSDTISFPNFGLEPRPELRGGSNKLECIIGFLDKKDVFREFIQVSAKGGELNMKTLKHYSVVTK